MPSPASMWRSLGRSLLPSLLGAGRDFSLGLGLSRYQADWEKNVTHPGSRWPPAQRWDSSRYSTSHCLPKLTSSPSRVSIMDAHVGGVCGVCGHKPHYAPWLNIKGRWPTESPIFPPHLLTRALQGSHTDVPCLPLCGITLSHFHAFAWLNLMP